MKRSPGVLVVVGSMAAGLLVAGTSAAQTVVSFQAEDLLLTRLGDGTTQPVALGAAVRAVAANARHAYALLEPGTDVARVDVQTVQERERIAVPCCASVLAVTADDRWLAAGGEAAARGRVSVFDLEAGFSLPRTIDTAGRIVREMLADGPRFVVASGDRERLPLLSRIFVTTIEAGVVATEDEIPGGSSLRYSYVGSKQIVVSGDGFDIVITRLGGGEASAYPSSGRPVSIPGTILVVATLTLSPRTAGWGSSIRLCGCTWSARRRLTRVSPY